MNDSHELKKHVHVIHSYNKFTLVQRKLVNALLYNAYYDLPETNTFSIKTMDLCRLIGFNSRDLKNLKKSLKGLLATVIEWNIIDADSKDQERWVATTMLSSAEIYRGWCTYSYSDLIRELLYQPEMYGNINIELMRKFRSNYGLALYENCIRFQNIKQTSWFSMQTFRYLMGVDDGKYKEFKDLKKRVISVGVKEVNELSPINITPEINKGKNEIRFLISRDKKQEAMEVKDNIQTSIVDEMVDVFGVDKRVAFKLLEQFGESNVRAKIDLIYNSPSFKSGSIKQLAGYLIDALSKDYQPPVSSNQVIRKLEEKKESVKAERLRKESILTERYEKYINDIYMKIEKSIPTESYLQMKSLYTESIVSNHIAYSVYKKQGFEHPMIKLGFREYLRKKLPDKFENVLTLSQFEEVFE